MANEKDKQADDFFRKLCAGGFRDQDKGIEGGHRNHRPKREKKKAQLVHLHVGHKFSVPPSEAPTDDKITHTPNLCVESGDFSELKLSGERKAFESAGQE